MGEWMSKFMYNGYNSKTIMIHTMLKGETIKSTLENYIVVVLKSCIDYNTCVSTDAFVKRDSEKRNNYFESITHGNLQFTEIQ